MRFVILTTDRLTVINEVSSVIVSIPDDKDSLATVYVWEPGCRSSDSTKLYMDINLALKLKNELLVRIRDTNYTLDLVKNRLAMEYIT
jgi:hypothetical protein